MERIPTDSTVFMAECLDVDLPAKNMSNVLSTYSIYTSNTTKLVQVYTVTSIHHQMSMNIMLYL